jgi:hypothetical protein
LEVGTGFKEEVCSMSGEKGWGQSLG